MDTLDRIIMVSLSVLLVGMGVITAILLFCF